MSTDKLKKLEEILTILNRDVPSTKEVADLVLRIASAVKEAKKALQKEAQENKEEISDLLDRTLEQITNDLKAFEKNIDSKLEKGQKRADGNIAQLAKELSDSLKAVKKLIPPTVDLSGIEKRLFELENKPDTTPEEIRDSLHSLNGDERLDKTAIKGLDEELSRIEKKVDTKPSTVTGGKQLMAVPFSFSGDGSTTQFYLPTEPIGKGWFLFAHYQGQWIQKGVHYALSKKVFDTQGGTSPFTPEDGTTIEGFLIF